jgi:hypothetical protein
MLQVAPVAGSIVSTQHPWDALPAQTRQRCGRQTLLCAYMCTILYSDRNFSYSDLYIQAVREAECSARSAPSTTPF